MLNSRAHWPCTTPSSNAGNPNHRRLFGSAHLPERAESILGLAHRSPVPHLALARLASSAASTHIPTLGRRRNGISGSSSSSSNLGRLLRVGTIFVHFFPRCWSIRISSNCSAFGVSVLSSEPVNSSPVSQDRSTV